MDKLLILGSDLGTVDIVKEMNRMGGYVIATDLMDMSPTKELSNEAWKISTVDIDELESAAREAGVTGVLAGASEINVDSVRMLCERLHLPNYCMDDEAYAVARDKSKFRSICKRVGAPVAPDYDLSGFMTRNELDAIVYPVVVKPVDQAGNKGVAFCNNEQELIEAYKYAISVSNKQTVICERQLHGNEWCVEYALADGEARLLLFSKEHHQPGETACLYSIINTSSCYLKKYMAECDEKVRQVFKEAGFKEGIAWVEVILDEDGQFYLLECGHRLTSEALYAFYEQMTSFNSIRWLIDTAFGVRHSVDQLPDIYSMANTKTSVAYSLFAKRAGTLHMSGLEDIEKLNNVTLDIPRRGGNNVNKNGLMGAVKIYGTCEEVIETFKYINKKLIINDDNGEDMLIRFNDYDAFRKDFNAGLIEMGIIK